MSSSPRVAVRTVHERRTWKKKVKRRKKKGEGGKEEKRREKKEKRKGGKGCAVCEVNGEITVSKPSYKLGVAIIVLVEPGMQQPEPVPDLVQQRHRTASSRPDRAVTCGRYATQGNAGHPENIKT